MRISALIDRLWTDILSQPWAVGLTAAVVMGLAFLAAVGLVVLARKAERALRRFVRECRQDADVRRRARLVTREPGRALAAVDDRALWHEAPPLEARPRCAPRHPDAFEIYRAISLATQFCREAADRKDAA